MAKATKHAAKVQKSSKAAKAKAPKAEKKAPAAKTPAPKAKTVSFANPYRAGSSYAACVDGLLMLGLNKFHGFDAVLPAVKKAMGSSLKEFAAKECRNEETGKDADQRIIQNVSVVARKDYGAKLRELGYEVRFNGREKQAGLFKM
jgi:hypothetical protein